jgi:flagellar assembly protein FliH
MSDKFKSSQFGKLKTSAESGGFEIQAEKEAIREMRVMKVDAPIEPVITDYTLDRLKRPGEGSYSTVKSKFGALAATDHDKVARSRKDARFSINSLLREPLKVEEEERRVIEERVRARVQAVSEEVRGAAAQKGYDEGLKQGYDEAFKKARAEYAERFAAFDEFLAQCETAKEQIFRANERFLIETVFRVAKMVLLRELTTDKDYVLRLATELIERVGVRENIRVKLSPADMATAAQLKEGLEKKLGALKNLNLEASPQVVGGGCVVETEWNAIDAAIETQLQGIHDALLGS